jgi:hypothetical protein
MLFILFLSNFNIFLPQYYKYDAHQSRGKAK